MRSNAFSPVFALAIGAGLLIACSNTKTGDDFFGGTAGTAGVSGAVNGAGGGAGIAQEEPPPEEGEAGTSGSGSGDGTGGDDTSGPAECADPTTTEGCDAYCAEYWAGCKTECNRVTACAPPKGFCAESESAYLACIAETGTFKAGADGCGVVHDCKRDASLCTVPECKTVTNGTAGSGGSSGKGGTGGSSSTDCGAGDPFGGGGSSSGSGCSGAGGTGSDAFGGGGETCGGSYADCYFDDECCSGWCEYDYYYDAGYCIGSGPTDPTPSCDLALVGENCGLDSDCCSDYCFKGKCKQL